MKYSRFCGYLLAILTIMLLLTACSTKNDSAKDNQLSNEAKAIVGSWAFVHDKETAIIELNEDGTARYEDKDYTFNCDEQFIVLKDSDGNELKLRYVPDNENIYLYISTTYAYKGEGKPDSIQGKWICEEKRWTYNFLEDQTFVEDDIFLGTYSVNEDNQTFKLVYKDPFDDTVCYYHLNNNELTIEYPWIMVKTSSK